MSNIEISPEVTFTLTGGEIATLIEAAHDSLYKRLKWSISLDTKWRDLPVGYASQMVKDLEQAHTKLYLAFRELGNMHDEFDEAFLIPDEVYELIDQVSSMQSWDEIETHRHAPSLCKLCKTLTRLI